jgi:zinc transport system substrate-binding protein
VLPIVKLGIVPILGRRTLVLTVLSLLVAGGCSARSSADGRLTVVAAFYPLAEAATQVGGSLVYVENLTPPGVEPHDLELTPGAIADVQSADVVLYLGHGFAPAIEQAAADANGITVDLLNGLALRPLSDETGSSGIDPHVWLDPVRYQELADRIEHALARAKPSEASTFQANADAFVAQLKNLDAAYRSGLAGCERQVIVTSHAAFGYLAARYRLTQEAIAGLAPEAEPIPERLADLAALVRNDGVTTIFTEELVSPKVAETLAREVGVRTAVLNPLEGLTRQDLSAGMNYLTVMRANLKALEQALGCPGG